MIEVLILAFALSMDAFAVSIGIGVKLKDFKDILALKVALYFGIFQGVMPLIGYFANIGLGSYIQDIDHYIAFVLLVLIGAKMLYESYSENTEDNISKFTNRILLLLAIATSIDAMAAGFTLNLLELNPIYSVLIITLITFIFSLLGVFIGTIGGTFLEDRAEKLGGIILILLGFKILIENLI